MTSDPYNHPLQPQPPRKGNVPLVLLCIASAIVAILCCLGAVSIFGADENNTLPLVTTTDLGLDETPATPPVPDAKAATKPATARDLTAKDVKLGVKITDKECFGSVVCNVEFKVTVDVPAELVTRSDKDWTVTYEVSGVKDGPQVGQLTLHPDGTFEQDAFQFGQTPNKSTKLKAKATDVEPVL
jgi:hypothetical protein